MGSLAVARPGLTPARTLSRWSRGWADGALSTLDASLVVASLVVGASADEAVLLGAFQRAADVADAGGGVLERRGSGGGAARIGPGCLWVQLRLPRPDALLAASPDKLLNRYVRPLLAAVTRASGVPAHYFGRDWISASHHPIALVGFAHEASSGRSLFEAIVGVRAPFSVDDRASFLGKRVATLDDVAGRTVDLETVAAAVADAYSRAADAARVVDLSLSPIPEAADVSVVASEPPWAATREEAIGLIGAGPDGAGRLRLGGELMASRDAVARLEELVSELPPDAPPEDVGRLVDEAFTTGGATLFGVRSLASIRDVLVEARQNMAWRTLEK